MASTDSINRLLALAASLAEQAAHEMRDAKLEAPPDQLDRMSRASAELAQVQQQLHRPQAEFNLDVLKPATDMASSSPLLNEYLHNAAGYELAGNKMLAIDMLQAFVSIETSPALRDIASAEIARLKGTAGAPAAAASATPVTPVPIDTAATAALAASRPFGFPWGKKGGA